LSDQAWVVSRARSGVVGHLLGGHLLGRAHHWPPTSSEAPGWSVTSAPCSVRWSDSLYAVSRHPVGDSSSRWIRHTEALRSPSVLLRSRTDSSSQASAT